MLDAMPRAGESTQGHEQSELLRWVAELYYVQQQGQAEIAVLIGASVSKVSRLLAEARRQGIVTIHVAASRVGDSELECALARQLGLEAVYVAPARVKDASVASRVAALTAARVLPRWLPSQGTVGISGGYTISQLAQALEHVPDELQRAGVVGDLCAHMFDSAGHFVDHELSQRTLAIPVEQLRAVGCVVAVAGGVTKAASLLGAVRTGVPRVLITDQLTAER